MTKTKQPRMSKETKAQITALKAEAEAARLRCLAAREELSAVALVHEDPHAAEYRTAYRAYNEAQYAFDRASEAVVRATDALKGPSRRNEFGEWVRS
jgi:hypothetical protein